MNEKMNFPNSFEEFIKNYEFKDNKEIYTNGCELIPTFRVMQGYEHYEKQIRAEVIDECIAFVKDNDSGCGNEWAIAKELEQLKENK